MRLKILLLFLIGIPLSLFAQEFQQLTNKHSVIYKGGLGYSTTSTIVLNFYDSTYSYSEWVHTGYYVDDFGKWDLKCDLLILNSDSTSRGHTRSKKSHKSLKKNKYRLFFNSCLEYYGDSIIQRREGYSIKYFRKER